MRKTKNWKLIEHMNTWKPESKIFFYKFVQFLTFKFFVAATKNDFLIYENQHLQIVI